MTVGFEVPMVQSSGLSHCVTIQRNASLPSSSLESKPSKKPMERAQISICFWYLLARLTLQTWRWMWYVPQKREALSKVHGITIHKTALLKSHDIVIINRIREAVTFNILWTMIYSWNVVGMSDYFLGKPHLSSVRKHFQLYVLTNSFCLVHSEFPQKHINFQYVFLEWLQDSLHLLLFHWWQ
jgi:hypothetical protein